MRRIGSLSTVGLSLLAAASVWRPAPAADPRVTAAPVAIDPDRRGPVRIGRLRFIGGWRLRSREPGFGGLSAMLVRGGIVTALSDRGVVSRFPLPPPDRVARLPLMVRPLAGGPPLPPKRSYRDGESLVADPSGRRIWVGFEKDNSIWRYDARWRPVRGRVLPALAAWPRNAGPEAMVRLPDGSFVIFCEECPAADRPGTTEALLASGDPTGPRARAVRWRYRPPAGFLPVDAAPLPDGRLLVLNRRATWTGGFAAALVRIDPRRIAPDATIAGEEIARLEKPLAIDNLEALAVTRERGRTIVWILSDDNFNLLQRTLLLKFALL